LTDEDLTDLSHLRLDLIGAQEVKEDGTPGLLRLAHLLPENPDGNYWLIMKPQQPGQLHLNFLSLFRNWKMNLPKSRRHAISTRRKRPFFYG
jgi:GTPase